MKLRKEHTSGLVKVNSNLEFSDIFNCYKLKYFYLEVNLHTTFAYVKINRIFTLIYSYINLIKMLVYY